MITFSEIHDAFLFVGSAEYGQNSAFLCPNTGRIFYHSDMGGIDEVLDEDVDFDDCLVIPHKNDLDLGQRLVFEFVDRQLPEDSDRVRLFFRKSGAYRRFKDLLESKDLLDMWYDFENQREEQALREWCHEKEIELSG